MYTFFLSLVMEDRSFTGKRAPDHKYMVTQESSLVRTTHDAAPTTIATSRTFLAIKLQIKT